MFKSNLEDMLDNDLIKSGERKILIDVAGDILQAETHTSQNILHLFNPNYIRTKDMINTVASRYDSESFINLSQRYATSEDTANKLVSIHRRRASENILEYLSREFFDGNRVRMEFNSDTMEMIIRVYVEDIDKLLESKIEDVFYRIRDRLLVAGIKKSIRVSLLLSDHIPVPKELYILGEMTFNNSPNPKEDYNRPYKIITFGNMPLPEISTYLDEFTNDFIEGTTKPEEGFTGLHPIGKEVGRFKLGKNKLSKKYTEYKL